MIKEFVKGAIIASAAAGLFASTGCGGEETINSQLGSATVKCQGINDCKGHGGCASTGDNDCQGLNECKGKGWLETTRDDCTSKGGTEVS
jgi:hypothetical protein